MPAPGKGDAFKKVRPGDKLRISATAFNSFIDAAQALRNKSHDRSSQDATTFRQTGIIKVKNCSGENRERFDVLGIDEPIFLPGRTKTHLRIASCLMV